MASALVKLNVNNTPNYLMLIHSSNINRVMDYGTFRSVTYFDPLQGLMYTISVSDSLDSVVSQAGMIRVNAINIDGQAFTASTVIGIQEFNISRVGEVAISESSNVREITYLNKGGGNNIIQVTDTLDSIQQQTIAAGGVTPSLAIISPPAGTYVANTVTITLSSNAIGASIYYTTNGATPTTSSTLYTAPFNITINTVVKAIAVLVGLPQGGVTEATINVKCFTPTVSPNGGPINSSDPITISTLTTSGTIRYTTDGSAPNSGSTLYTAPIFLSAGTTLRSRTFKTNLVDSDIRDTTFTVFTELMVAGNDVAGGRLWRSFNNGLAWTEIRPLGNVNNPWRSASVGNGGGFIVVGDANNRVFWSNDNGGTWTEVFSPNSNVLTAAFKESFDGDQVMTRGTVVNSAQPNLFISSNYGETWSALTVDGFSNATSTWRFNVQGQTILTSRGGTGAIDPSVTRISKDGGTTWITPSGATVGTNRIVFLEYSWISEDEMTIICPTNAIAGGGAELAISTNGGTSFTTTTLPQTGMIPFVVGAANGSRIYIARLARTILSEEKLWYSDNLGTTWTLRTALLGDTNNYLNASCSKDGKIVALGSANDFWVSTDFGINYVVRDPSVTSSWTCVANR